MTATNDTSLEVPPAGTYRLDPTRSVVSYSGRHMFGTGSVHATFAITSGVLRVAESTAASEVTVSVNASSFHSNSPKRDKDVKSARLLDVEKYPDITFISNQLRQDGGCWLVAGTVTAHGTAVPVGLTVDQVTRDVDGLRVHACAGRLDRYSFGITGSKGLVGRYLDLDFDVFATPV